MAEQYPFDAIDLISMLLAPSHPAFLVLAVLQYWARRSTWVAEAFIDAGLLTDLPDTQFAREALPGAAKLLLPPEGTNLLEEKQPDPLVTPSPPVPTMQPLALAALANDDNILVVGPKGSGKTTLLRRLIALRNGQHIALDPHSTPDKWPCQTVGGGLEYGNIAAILGSSYSTMCNRYKAMAQGKVAEAECRQRRYTLVADEFRSISKALPRGKDADGASEILLELLSQGRKAGLAVLIASHADTVKALGIEGEGDLRTSFDWWIYLGGLATRKAPAAAQMDRPAVAYHPERDVWHLLSLDDATNGYARAKAARPRAVAPFDDSAVLASMLAAKTPDNAPSRDDGALQGHHQQFPATRSGVAESSSVAQPTVSPEEITHIVVQLQRGRKPGQVAKSLPGYNGRNYREYRAKVDIVQQMLDAQMSETEVNDDDGSEPTIVSTAGTSSR